MKKSYLSITCFALILSVVAIFKTQQTPKMVYVDLNRLIEGYEKTPIVRAEFQKKATLLRANVDSLMMNWQEELKTYEKERSKMTKKELALKQELLGNHQQRVNNYQQAVQKQLKEADQKTTQTIVNDINGYLEEFGKKHKHSIIFGASGAGNIMYANEDTDLTQEVLDGLNAAYEN